MGTRILEIVFYLVDYIQEGHGQLSNLTDLSTDLKGLGYSDKEIASAYSWILEHLNAASEHLYSAFPEVSGSTRILTEAERARLTPEAYGFLTKLSGLEMIDSRQVEVVLEHVDMFGHRTVSLEQLKLIISAVAFDESGQLDSQSLLDDESDSVLHVN